MESALVLGIRRALSCALAASLWAMPLFHSARKIGGVENAGFSLAMAPHPRAAPAPLPMLRYEWAGDFAEGLAPVRLKGKYGYVDTAGSMRIPPAYDMAAGFSGHRAAVLKGGVWGYLDVTGWEIIPPAYSAAGAFAEGLASVAGENGYGFIDSNGIPQGEALYSDARPYSQGLAAVRLGDDENAAWAFIDKRGAQVIPPLFPDVQGGFSEGLALVRVESEMPYRSGFIDSSGGFAIDTLYDAAGDFHEGLAPVGRGQWRGNRFLGTWGYIDRSGRSVVASGFAEAGPFRNGKALVRMIGGGNALIDRSGRLTCAYREDAGIILPDQGDLVTYQLRETAGFLDTRGKTLTATPFAEAGPFREERARVRVITAGPPVWAYIDRHGKYVGGTGRDAPR